MERVSVDTEFEYFVTGDSRGPVGSSGEFGDVDVADGDSVQQGLLWSQLGLQGVEGVHG